MSIDSSFTQAGAYYSNVKFEYDENDNVIAYQEFVNQGSSIYSQGRWTFEYDTRRSPYYNIGQQLYTAFGGGGGNNYFYLSKNNPLKASLNSNVMTPGGGFTYQYYTNSFLKTSAAKDVNSWVQVFYYTQ